MGHPDTRHFMAWTSIGGWRPPAAVEKMRAERLSCASPFVYCFPLSSMVSLIFDPCHTVQHDTLCIKALLQETDKIMKPYDIEAWHKPVELKQEAFASTSFGTQHAIQCENKCLPSNIYLVNMYFHTPSTLAVAFLPGKLERHGTNGCGSGRVGGLAIMTYKYAPGWTSTRVSWNRGTQN